MNGEMNSKTVQLGKRRINLVKVAKYQRWLIICIGALLLFNGLSIATNAYAQSSAPSMMMSLLLMSVGILGLLTGLTAAVFTGMLGRAAGQSLFTAILTGILVAVPCAGLIVLILVNQRVTGMLQGNGVQVGFLGVPADAMNKLREGGCTNCGYDIRNLPPGPCPECGLVFSHPMPMSTRL